MEIFEYESDRFTALTEVQFFRNNKMKEHKRSIYGPLNFLGDVGGLTDALFGIGSVLVYLV